MSIQARTHRPRGDIGRGVVARSGRRRGRRDGGCCPSASAHAAARTHREGRNRGEEPRLALPQPMNHRAPPGLPGRASCGRRLFPARRERLPGRPFTGRRFPPRLAAPPSPRRSGWYVPFCCSRARWSAAGGGGSYHFRVGKGGRRGRGLVP